MTLHPLRCETCNHLKCEHAIKDGYFPPRKKFAWNHTLVWGCASHPAALTEQDKVLDRVVRIVKEWRSDYWNEQISVEWFKAKIKEFPTPTPSAGDQP